ncbi:MAG TPA: hypothetical protein VLM84_04195, partial [Chromatiaceae bacterium]|nr:hypothetical protein [Chromatiaceae bacterium]
TTWNVIKRDKNSILYEWQIKNCPGSPDQTEIARIIQGNENLWRLAYTAKTTNLSKQKRKDWIESLLFANVTAKIPEGRGVRGNR